MGWIFVIEENQTLFGQIEDAISQIEPKVTIIRFPNSHSFLAWVGKFIQADTAINPPVPKDKFLGIVTAVDAWKFRDVKLIGKFKALFVQKGLATNEEELGVVFTGYEKHTQHRQRFQQKGVNNFIFKPFDKIVLRQVLEIAFGGRAPVKKFYVHNQKMEASVEMLKEIVSTGLTELGFRSISEHSLEVGAASKYYADFLMTDQHRSALAHVQQVEKPAFAAAVGLANPYNIYLRFFALDQQQSFNLQRLVRDQGQKVSITGIPSRAEDFEFIFVQHPKSSLCQELEPSVERFYDHPIKVVHDLTELSAELARHDTSRLHQRRFVYIDHLHVIGNEIAELQAVQALAVHANVSLFLLSQAILPEPLERELNSICEDIFYPPFNRSYVMKGLKQRWTALRTKEELFQMQRSFEQRIHVSNPVKLVEVSEACLVIEYNRELAIGSFREFVLHMPNEVAVPNLVGQCNFVKRVDGKKSFYCHFIFFGLNEAELKYIRLWMLHQYIDTKQE